MQSAIAWPRSSSYRTVPHTLSHCQDASCRDQACRADQVASLGDEVRSERRAAKRRAGGFTRMSTIRTIIFIIAGKLDFRVINPVATQPL
jgi:hypothetical protein